MNKRIKVFFACIIVKLLPLEISEIKKKQHCEKAFPFIFSSEQ